MRYPLYLIKPIHIYRYCVLLVAIFFCTGCMTGAAIIQSPEALKLNPEPPRNYELSLDVRVAGKPYHIDYSWNCEHKKHFTASVMQWVLSWQSEFKIVAKQIGDGMTLFIWQPSSAYCVADSANFIPKVLVTNGEKQPASATFFDAWYDTKESKVLSDVVVQGVVRRVQAPSALGKMTVQEEELANSLSNDISHYVSRRIAVVPESEWRKYKGLEEIFSTLTEPTRAMDIPHKNLRSSGFFRFNEPNAFPLGRNANEGVSYYSPILREGALLMDQQTPKRDSNVFRYESGKGEENQIQFCHLGACIFLEGAMNEIYYPTSRELVSVFRSNLKHAFHN